MKIRIVKAERDNVWYADKIGRVFDVVEYDETLGMYVVNCDGLGECYIFARNAEEVIEHNSQLYRKVDRPVREGDTVLITKFEGEVVNVVRTVESVVSAYPGDFHFTPLYDGEYYFDGETEECEVLELIEETTQLSAPPYAEVSELLHEADETKAREGFIESAVKASFDKVAEINGAAFKRLADSDDIVEHSQNELVEVNGKQYRKVKRKAVVGELVVVTKASMTFGEYTNGAIFTVTDLTEDSGYVRTDSKWNDGSSLSLTYHEYHVLEPIEQSGQSETLTERDLLANLAQEVAELKRQLTNAQTDIADLEDRVDENEKDTEELIGRINDLGDGAEAVDLSGVLTELTRLEVDARECSEDYGEDGQEALEQYFEGVADGYKSSIIKLKEALRNG